MASITRDRALQVLTPYKENIIEGGIVIVDSVTRQVAESQFYSLLSFFVGRGPTEIIKITFPYMNHTTKKVAKLLLKGDLRGVWREFYESQRNYVKEVTFSFSRSPKNLVTLHAEHYCRKGSLKWVCQTLSGYSESWGSIFYIAAAPVVAPVVSPITKFSIYTLCKIALGFVTTKALPSLEEKKEVELDDFKEEEWTMVEEDDFKEESEYTSPL